MPGYFFKWPALDLEWPGSPLLRFTCAFMPPLGRGETIPTFFARRRPIRTG